MRFAASLLMPRMCDFDDFDLHDYNVRVLALRETRTGSWIKVWTLL